MIEVIKKLLLDFMKAEFPASTSRLMETNHVFGKAGIYTGVRHCGKSVYLFQLMQQLLGYGVQRQNIIYLNFLDDRLHNLRHSTPSIILEAYFSIYPEKKNVEKIYCFFDEIQVIDNWQSFTDWLLRTEKCEVYIATTSSKISSPDNTASLQDKSLLWEVFPFSFREFLTNMHIECADPLSTKNRFMIQKAFDDFWEKGGFPKTLDMAQPVRITTHQEYWETMLLRDMIEQHDIAHPRALIDLAHHLMDNVASLHSINNLTAYLKSLGHKVPKTTVSQYLDWFENAYLFFTVRIFDPSPAKANVNPKKVYCIDHALIQSVSSGVLVQKEQLLENIVFMALRRMSTNIRYYKTKTGKDVDFIVRDQGTPGVLIQTSSSMVDTQTRKRKIKALEEAMSEQNLSESIIVTLSEAEVIETKAGSISLIPAWRFLLNLS